MQKKFEKFKFKKIKFFQKERIKYRGNTFITKRLHDDKIVLMKLNFIERLKGKKFKKQKKKTKKNEKKKKQKNFIFEIKKNFLKN